MSPYDPDSPMDSDPTFGARWISPCPECDAGKHPNCDGRSWDNEADDYTPCPCAQLNHGRK